VKLLKYIKNIQKQLLFIILEYMVILRNVGFLKKIYWHFSSISIKYLRCM